MAELETTEVDDIIIDEVETIETDNIETELTVDDYQKEKTRREKAEKALVELKKQLKNQPKSKEDGEYITKEELEVEKFITKNPDLEEYREDLNKYKKLGLSLEKAKLLIENDDKTIENRKKTNSMNVTDGENSGKSTYTYDELEKMSQAEYNRVKDLQMKGKVTFKR